MAEPDKILKYVKLCKLQYLILATPNKIKSIFEHTLCLTTQNLKDLSRKRKPKPCLANVTLERKFQLQHDKLNYCKVASINTSQLEACFRFYILLIKEKFGSSFSVVNFGNVYLSAGQHKEVNIAGMGVIDTFGQYLFRK